LPLAFVGFFICSEILC